MSCYKSSIGKKSDIGSPILDIHMTKTCHLSLTLATAEQLKLIENFCCGSESHGILGIDMTYNVGPYFVTPTTIRHPYLIHSKTMVEPTLLGPTIIHTEHGEQVYRSFAADLVNANPALSRLKFLGSDRALEMYKGFKLHMPALSHVVCFKHFKDNIEAYLRSKIKSENDYLNIHQDIFHSLLECSSTAAFDEMLMNFKPMWDDINENVYKWFDRYQTATVRSSLLQVKRPDADLREKLLLQQC